MGNPLLGRNASIKLGSVTVLNMASWDMSFDTEDLDASVFGTGWGATMPGIQKWVVNVAGFYDPTDTTGQMVLQAAKIAATKITTLRFYVNAASYWTPNLTVDSDAGCYIGTQTIKADKSGLVAVSFKVGGVGPPLFVG